MSQNTERQNTEERILKAAEQEFLAKGYGGARTTAIASAAGVTHAMLHYYFRTKENLFQRIISEKISKMKGLMFSTLLNTDMPLEEKITFAICNHLDFLAENPDLPSFMISIINSNPEWNEFLSSNVTTVGRKVIEGFQEDLDRNAANGVCRPTDARMLLLDILSLNVFSFVGAPMINFALGEFNDSDFIEKRKKNNVEIILNKLKP